MLKLFLLVYRMKYMSIFIKFDVCSIYSFNSLAILLVCMGAVTIIVIGTVMYMNFLAPGKGSMNEAFLSNA